MSNEDKEKDSGEIRTKGKSALDQRLIYGMGFRSKSGI